MDWMMMPLRRYADFTGRSTRKEFWMFTLLYMIVILVLYCMILAGVPWAELIAVSQAQEAGVAYTGTEPAPGLLFWPGVVLLIAWALGTFVPALAVTVRRLHDQDKSGWFYLLNFVPFGSIVLLVFYCLEGTKGPNQYGPDPLADERATFT